MSGNSRPVYSSEAGRLCPGCGQPREACRCREAAPRPSADGIVRIRRESKGRGGKTVTVVTGLPLAGEALRSLAGELKRRCGTGGTVKDDRVEIQGDQVETLLAELQRRGYRVKRAGG